MKVHFIAIGGSAMHNLAIALRQKGIAVRFAEAAEHNIVDFLAL